VKLSGWIKSAVEFIKPPAGTRKVDPQPDASSEVDGRIVPQDAVPDRVDVRPKGKAQVGSETAAGIEPESSEPKSGPKRFEPRNSETRSPETRSPETRGPETRDSEPKSSGPNSSPDQQEVDRRRGMVRKFFNDYWASVDDKPPSFAERLDGAEGYINERVAAGGEAWQLDPATRKQLGLPPSRKRA
jgi:hypothetical protein